MDIHTVNLSLVVTMGQWLLAIDLTNLTRCIILGLPLNGCNEEVATLHGDPIHRFDRTMTNNAQN